MFDVQAFKEIYPEQFDSTITYFDLVRWFIVFILPFLVPYLYIRFFESRAILYFRYKIKPFLKFRLHLDKPVSLIQKILHMKIFKNSGSRFNNH